MFFLSSVTKHIASKGSEIKTVHKTRMFTEEVNKPEKMPQATGETYNCLRGKNKPDPLIRHGAGHTGVHYYKKPCSY